MPQLTLPRGWNQRVQAAILQTISLGRHCFFLVVGRMARSPKALDRAVAETECVRRLIGNTYIGCLGPPNLGVPGDLGNLI